MEGLQVSKTIIIATKNVGKAKEFKKLFAKQGYTIKTLLDFPNLKEVEETGITFEENARLKAETIATQTGKIVISDDSGLCVDTLMGEPGVRSARYAGNHDDNLNNARLLAVLGELPDEPRKAHFNCTMVAATPGKESLVAVGICDGEIVSVPRGTNGFGYDPLFEVDGTNKTFGEMSQEEKNKYSHRAKATKALFDHFDDWLRR